MQRWGRTHLRRQRWRCPKCSCSNIRKRSDLIDRCRQKLFKRWLSGSASLSETAHQAKCHRKTLIRWFAKYWGIVQQPVIPQSLSDTCLVVDAVYLAGHHECVLIGCTGKGAVVWTFAEQETLAAWHAFFSRLPKPLAVICDGQSGLLSALKTIWPDVPVQRCLAHIQRLAIQKLTRRPQTAAGQELLSLVHVLHGVRTAQDRACWVANFEAWNKRCEVFLKERTYGIHPSGKRSWWYTHRRIRALNRTMGQSLPNLFAFIDWPGLPRTTNLVEGGINSRLKELLHRHRGLNLDRKKVLVALFLESRNGFKKPTQNVP